MKPIYRVLSVLLFSSVVCFATGFPSSYYKLSAKAQKREFINILKPMVDRANSNVMKQRVFIENFFNKALSSSFRSLDPKDLKKLLKISKTYRIKNLFNRDEYLKRVNVVPVALALVQGAIESGWGKSRFVREANNIFGHWTWGKVGLIPAGREEGKTHKIRIFRTLQASVDAYILNLNRHNAYKAFRELRFKKAKEGKVFSGYEAANTMINYSELGKKYVKMLHKMMRDYKLLYYDRLENKNTL